MMKSSYKRHGPGHQWSISMRACCLIEHALQCLSRGVSCSCLRHHRMLARVHAVTVVLPKPYNTVPHGTASDMMSDQASKSAHR
eukprot:3874058-Prymnesium_polylepis.2